MVILRDQPANVVAVDIAVHLCHVVKVLLVGQTHERIGIAGEEHIVLRRTPVLQEGVQASTVRSLASGGMVGRGH